MNKLYVITGGPGILPPWQEIYKTDTERKQTWEEAVYTYQQLKLVYARYGYETINVPIGSIEDRKRFISSWMKSPNV